MPIMRPARLALDGLLLLVSLLLAATVGQGWPSPDAVGLPLTWKVHFLAIVALLAVLTFWTAIAAASSRIPDGIAESTPAAWTVLALFILIAKAPYTQLPYFWDAMGYVASGAWETYNDDFPLILSPLFDSGHPPLFYLLLALVWKVFAPTPAVSHLFNLGWGILAAWGTYTLGRRLYGPLAGFWAALLLTLSPLFYTQIGTLHFEPSLAALTVWAVYFALAGRVIPYLFCATAMVLIKEPSVVLVPAVVVAVWWRERQKATPLHSRRQAAALPVLYALPLVPLAVWLIYHRVETGWFLTPPGVPKEARLFLPQVYGPLLCVFKEQFRWLPSLACGVFIASWLRRRPTPLGEWLRSDAVGLPLIFLIALAGYWLPTATVFLAAVSAAHTSTLLHPGGGGDVRGAGSADHAFRGHCGHALHRRLAEPARARLRPGRLPALYQLPANPSRGGALPGAPRARRPHSRQLSLQP
ncbi:glycosyltransferase family 39 protein [bacterium]|nr:glycosyltransferase family 39 protein [bacterium]